MHIKDHSAAMKFFRTYDNVASKGKWKEFVDEMEFDSMLQEPRTMAQEPRNMYAGGQLVQNTVDGSRPGYQGKPDVLGRVYETTALKARPIHTPGTQGFQPTYHKFYAAGDKKLIREWKKSLTDAAQTGDMSETTGFKEWLTKKFDKKTTNTIRNRVRLQLGFFSGQEYAKAQENFVKSLIKKSNNSDKILDNKRSIVNKTPFDRTSPFGKRMWELMDDPKTGLEDINTKINKALDKIIDGNLTIKASKKVTPHISKYGPLIQMIAEISGAGSTRTINDALAKNPRFKNKEFAETFKYLNRAHAKDFIGLPFDEALEYAKFRQGGLDIKGLVSYTTKYQNPESNIMSFAVRHANRHFKDNSIKSQIQFYKLRADGTKGASLKFENLPKNRDGNRVLDIKKVGFEYKNQFFHRNNLKTKGYKSGLFDEVYALSGKNRLMVPDPNNLSKKITLKELLQMTGDQLTIGHDESLGGVKGSPFKSLRLQGEKLNLALFHAYDKIKNKDLRKLVLNELELIVPKGKDYQTAFIEGKIDEAKKAIDTTDTLYRGAGKKVIAGAASDFPEWGLKKQTEALRVAGIDLSKEEGRKALKALGVKVENILKKKGVSANERGFIATALLEDFGKLGLKGGKLLRWLQLEYDVAFESLIYQYAKKYKGYDHDLAREELFLPKMIAKVAPKLWETLGFKPFKTGFLEGADPLIEKELYEIKGTEKENLGKVIGERSQVKKYIDAQKTYQKEVDKYNKLDFELDMMTSNKLRTPTPPEVLEAKKKEIVDQEELIIGLEATLKPGTPAYEAYMRAKEKQDHKFGMGKIKSKAESDKIKEERRHDEYLEYKGGKQRSFYLPKGKLKERVEDPLYKKPYTFLETDQTLRDIVSPGKEFWEEHGLTDTQVGPVIKEGIKEKWKQIYDMGGIDLMDRIGIAGGVSKMAEGGIMNLKKKW